MKLIPGSAQITQGSVEGGGSRGNRVVKGAASWGVTETGHKQTPVGSKSDEDLHVPLLQLPALLNFNTEKVKREKKRTMSLSHRRK